MRKILILFLFLVSICAHAQVQKGTGIFYFTSEPTLPINVCYDGEVGIDTTTGLWWEYSRDFGFWILAGFRVQKFATCAAPTYTPADKQSEIVLNDCDSLYRWRAGAWHHLNPFGAGIDTSGYNLNFYISNDSLYIVDGNGAFSVNLDPYMDNTDTSGYNLDFRISGDTLYIQDGAGELFVLLSPYTNTATNLTFSGSSSPVTLNSSTGTDVTITAGTGIGLVATSGNITITNTAPDQVVSITDGGGIVVTGTYPAFTLTAVDQSTTNESLTISDGTNSEALGGQTLVAAGAGINVVSYSIATNTMTITGTEVDGSITNEGVLGVGTGGASSSVITSNTSGATGVTINAVGILAISESTSSNGGSITFTATEVDGSTSNELQTIANTSNATTHTATLSNSGGSIQLAEGAGITLTTTGTGLDGIVTIASTITQADGSETIVTAGTGIGVTGTGTSGNPYVVSNTGDLSATNEAWTIDGDDSDTELITTQTVKFQGGGIVVTDYIPGTDILTITGTEVDGSVTNEAWTVDADAGDTEVIGNQTLLFSGAGIVTTSYNAAGNAITITGTEVDGSTSNELQTYGHSGTTSYTNTMSNGGGSFTLQSSGIVTISNSSGTVTIGATEVDGSVTNELQTLANTSNATTHTVTLSNSGGSIQLVEGANVTLTTTGTGLDGIVTIAATSGSGTDLSFSGTSSPVTLVSNTGTDVTITAGTGISLSATSTDLIITNTVVNTDAQNLTIEGAGPTYDIAISGGTDVTIQGAGIVTLSESPANTLIVTATEVDGSVTNEGVLGVSAGTATSSVITSNTSGANGVTINAVGILSISESTSSNGGSITLTATEVDGSTSNELQTYGHSGTTSYTNTLSNGGGSFTLQSGGIVTLSHSAGTTTISATEVDGSTTNEAWTIDADDADTEVISNQTVKFQGSGITTTDYNPATDVLLITSTEVDGSVSNELQTLANTSNATTHTVTLSNSGGSIQLVEGANVTLTTTGTGLDGIVTIAATSGSGTDLSFSGTSSPVTLNSNTGTDVTFTQGGIVTISATSGNITISATEVDGSTTNELQTIANTSDATSHTVTLSNSGGSVQLVEGTGVSLTTTGTSGAGIVTIANTGDLSATNEAWTIDGDDADTELITTQTVKFQGAGITTTDYNTTTDVLLITSTEVDGSTSNELQTYGHSGTTSYTNTLSNGGGSFTLQSSGIVTISNSSGTVTIGATEVDGSVTNELQTLANTSNATTHTATLSNSGGSIQFTEGTGITLTTTGTGLDGIVTIAATAANTDLTFSGASSPVTLNSSTGTDVTITAGGIISLSATSGNITITATEVDGSTTNEAWTIDADDADTEVISNQTVKFQGAGITATDYNTATDVLLITSTEVDGSTTNELQTYGHSGTTSYTNTLSIGGGSFTLQSSGIVTISNSSGTVTIGAAEVDGSTTNELQTYGHAGTTTYTNTLSSGGGSFSITGAGINVVTQTAGAVTITATEVDGSVTNEGVLGVGAGSGTSSTLLSNTSGANAVTINAAGILAISESTSSNGGSITLTATEVDGSTSNELQTIANTSDATSHTVTLSNSGGSIQLVEGSNITLTTTGTSGAGIVTIAATTGTDQNGIYGEGGVAGTGDGTLPSGGSEVTVPGDWQPLEFITDAGASKLPTAIRVTTDFCGDAEPTKYFVGKSPSDSLEIYNIDCTTAIKGTASYMSIESTGILQLYGDSILIDEVPLSTTLPYIGGFTTGQHLKRIEGTATGQILQWNETNNYWEIGTPSGGGAPTDAQYVTLASNGTLSAERVLTAGLNVNISDAGANSTVTINALDTEIAPSQLTSNQADWNPTGFSTANIIRITGDGSFRQIQGFTSSSTGKRIAIYNAGSNAILLPKRHNSSSIKFRMSKDIVLFPGISVEFIYDATNGVWRPISNPEIGNHEAAFSHKFEVPRSTTTGDFDFFTYTSSTAASNSSPSAGQFGGLTVGTGSSSTGTGYVTSKGTPVLPSTASGSATWIYYHCSVKTPSALSSGSETYTIRCGLMETLDAANNDGAFFRYTHSENSGQWTCVTRNSGAETATSTSITVGTSTVYDLEVYIRPDGTAEFFIAGNRQTTHSTNMPDSPLGTVAGILKSAGTGTLNIDMKKMVFESALVD